LNPRFVEWLMGYPTGWASVASNCTPSVMQLCHYRQHMRSLLWQKLLSEEQEIDLGEEQEIDLGEEQEIDLGEDRT
jgi:hypothetical protein